MDSLPDGTVVVRNEGRGMWPENAGWALRQELLIGSLDTEGPDNFGRISSFTVDDRGRVWVLESQAAELRTFDPSGLMFQPLAGQESAQGSSGNPPRGHSVADAWPAHGLADQLLHGQEFAVPGEPVLALVAASPCSAHDCEHVALAEELAVPLVTEDRQHVWAS